MSKTWIVLAVSFTLALACADRSANAQGGAQPVAPPVTSAAHTLSSSAAPMSQADTDRALYVLGVTISRNLEEFQLSPAEFDKVRSGLADGFNHRASAVDVTAETPKVQALRRQRAELFARRREEAGRSYLEKVAALAGARRTASGLVMVPIHQGNGASPGLKDSVTVNYVGKLIDGSVFDSTRQSGEPAIFSLSAVIPCWSEALPLMKTGETSRIVCPPELAYGARGAPSKIGPGSTLDFEVELLSVAPAIATAASAPSPGTDEASR